MLLGSAQLWPTKMSCFMLDDCEAHCKEIERIVLDRPIPESFMEEVRVMDLEQIDSDSVRWLIENVKSNVSEYMGQDTEISVKSRAVIIRKGCHLRTHTERDESDLAVAFWPSGDYEKFSPVNAIADGYRAPAFVLEDPSRGLCDDRLSNEGFFSFYMAPRPGLMTIFPSHVPHSMYPYMGEKPFVHIVFQIRFLNSQ